MLVSKNFIRITVLLLLSGLLAGAQPTTDWIQRWNREEGREIELKTEDVLFKASTLEQFNGLQAVGFLQSDGTFPLGRLIWKGTAYSPLKGLGQVLTEHGFSQLSEADRSELFLSLLQQSYGLLGTRVYTGARMHQDLGARPEPLRSNQGADGSHRFQVWFYEFPSTAEEGEWREVLYYVSADGATVKARTLGTYHPQGENLRGFPSLSSESFE